MKKLIAIAVFMAALTAGCSNQWRDTDPGVSGQEVLSMLGEVASSASLGGGALTQALTLKDDPATAIYFAEAENSGSGTISPMGTVQSILSFYNFAFLGLTDLNRDQISGARVFFLDQKAADGTHNCGLIVAVKRAGSGEFSYYGFTGQGAVNDGEFDVTMNGDSGNAFLLSSFDVDGTDLMQTIQLKMWDSNGAYNGKFSTLFGFSQQ